MSKKSKYENVDFGNLPSNYLINLGKEQFAKNIHNEKDADDSKIDKVKLNKQRKGD